MAITNMKKLLCVILVAGLICLSFWLGLKQGQNDTLLKQASMQTQTMAQYLMWEQEKIPDNIAGSYDEMIDIYLVLYGRYLSGDLFHISALSNFEKSYSSLFNTAVEYKIKDGEEKGISTADLTYHTFNGSELEEDIPLYERDNNYFKLAIKSYSN